MELSKYLRDHSRTIEGKQQHVIGAFAKALEVIPRQLCDNAGIDGTDVLNRLRMMHARGETWAGVDVENEGVADNMERFVWEPALVKINALQGATEAACLVLSVDETVRSACAGSTFELTSQIRNPRSSKPRRRVRHAEWVAACAGVCREEGDRAREGSDGALDSLHRRLELWVLQAGYRSTP